MPPPPFVGNSVTVVTVGGAGGLGLKKLVARVARRGEKLGEKRDSQRQRDGDRGNMASGDEINECPQCPTWSWREGNIEGGGGGGCRGLFPHAPVKVVSIDPCRLYGILARPPYRIWNSSRFAMTTVIWRLPVKVPIW